MKLFKSSEDGTFFPTYYDAQQVRINQQKHLSPGVPLSYHLTKARQSACQGCFLALISWQLKGKAVNRCFS